MNDSRRLTTNIERALERCASEPIHIPGSVQPAGAMLVLNPPMDRVLQASENCEDFLGAGPRSLLGGDPGAVLGRPAIQELRDDLQARPDALAHAGIRSPSDDRQWLQVRAHRSDDCVVVEVEPDAPPAGAGSAFWSSVNEALARLREADTPQDLMDEAVSGVRLFTGHDRVMLYLFDADWNGRVEAESRIPETDSYLGHHFPASDIPPQARALYERASTRVIFDVDGRPAPLVPQRHPESGEPVDLSRAVLRAVAPIHLQYLRNMNVGSSLSVAVRGRDGLRGLIACHSRGARHPLPARRQAVETLARFFSERLLLLEQRMRNERRRRAHEFRVALGEKTSGDIGLGLDRQGADMLDLLGADGAVIAHDVHSDTLGDELPRDTLDHLVDWLSGESVGQRLSTDRLADLVPAGLRERTDLPAGLLAVRLHLSMPGAWLIFFRHAVTQVTEWAGDPNKPVETDTGGPRLTPRRSFATWREENHDRARPWTDLDIELAEEYGHTLSIILSRAEVRRLNELLQREQDELAARNQELERLGRIDGLTELYNRQYIESMISDEIAIFRRYGERTFSILFLDLDHFKQINDTHGHAVGDEVLKGLSGVVSPILRESDRLARWGGEEFLVFLPATGIDGALTLAERLRVAVENASDQLPVAVTASIGVAEYDGSESVDHVIRRADDALYAAKDAGRNRVYAAQD